MTLLAALVCVRALLDPPAPPMRPERAAPERGSARLLYGAPLDPNREPAEVLALLPGLGPARAADMVATRPFCALADLDRVPGIGPATLRALAAVLTFRDLPSNCEPELRPIGH
jgi:hypothetical protein